MFAALDTGVEITGVGGRLSRSGDGVARRGFVRMFLTSFVFCLSSGAAAFAAAAAPVDTAQAAASTGPQCTFNGSSLPLLTGVSAGSKIAIKCTGLPALHPYMLVGTSLVVAIDPAAAPLFSGQVTSLSGLLSLLTALKEIDVASATTPTSDASGDLNTTWTVPTFQAADPNASCPPTTEEFNSGLLGCALAMIDLTSFKPVGAGSALFEYSGFPLFPPNPTLALSASTADPGQTVSVSDAAGATTYWWLATLDVLQSALGSGGGATPTVNVAVVDSKGRSVSALSNALVTPASYSNGVFTPPALSGGFTVPSNVTGPVKVNVSLTAPLDGIPVSNTASASLFVDNPPTTSVVLPANGASLAGSGHLDATAFDYGTLTKVEFHLTGGSLNQALIATATPTIYGWLAAWNTTAVPNGTYTLQSEAYDAAGLSGYSSGTTVTVDNAPPSTSVVVPSTGATVKGTQVALDASAASGVNKVQYELTGGTLNGSVIATATPTVYGWLASWNSETVPDGTYTLQSVASYAGGVSGVSAGVSVTVGN
jgi:Bacterial Ig domain